MALLSNNRMASNRRRAAALELMTAARAILAGDVDTVVSVSEHDCVDPECRGMRTVVLVMRPDRPTEAVKINKPLEAVTKADLAQALTPFAVRHIASATPPAVD